MTPAARVSAAIEVLDAILTGNTADAALTRWGRSSRFAGSGDRAAVRDLVFDALRCKRSFAALGGLQTGRGLIAGGLRDKGLDPNDYFTGEGHAPARLSPLEAARTATEAEAHDLPDWLWEQFCTSLGADASAVAKALRQRAPVFLRVNRARASVEDAVAALAEDQIKTAPSQLAKFGLEVVDNARKIQTSKAYLGGLVELQDAASQAVVEALPLQDGMRVLDYCAGGGGKTLAMAAAGAVTVFAHDAEPRRMRDLSARAARANAAIKIIENDVGSEAYDLILADAPCSGSGSWRRDPQGKWALTPARLQELTEIQAGILDKIAAMIPVGGVIAYATCSVLNVENTAQIESFMARSAGFERTYMRQFGPLDGGDGFFLAQLTRVS